jgi:hypothetical protein
MFLPSTLSRGMRADRKVRIEDELKNVMVEGRAP